MRLTRRGAIAGAGALALSACGGERLAPAGLLRAALDTEPDSLDPLKGQFASAALMYKQLHAPLTEYGPAGGLAPGLAQSWRSDDAMRWVFRLRPGLAWSDGAPLTADDVVWTARRAVDPATGFADLGDFFAVEGAQGALAGERAPETIGVAAPDPLTVVFQLDRPVGAFPVLMREFYPLPRHAVEAEPEDWTRPEHWVSAGPYVLARRGALAYELAANPRFHAADSVSIPAARVSVVEDAATRARLFRAGDLDLADRPPPDQIAFLRERLGDRLKSWPAPILTYLKVNTRKPGLADVRVRRALSLSIDRRFLSERFFNGEATPSEHVIPDDERDAPRPDPDRAAALLSEAGYGPGRPLSVSLRASAGGRERLAVAIADDLERAGFACRILATYPVDLYQAVDGGDFDLALSRYDRGLKTEPDFMVQPFARGGFADDAGWEGPERERFDALMREARGRLDADARAAVHAEAEAILLDAQAVIPLLHERAYWMVSDRVELAGPLQPQLWRDLALG